MHDYSKLSDPYEQGKIFAIFDTVTFEETNASLVWAEFD